MRIFWCFLLLQAIHSGLFGQAVLSGSIVNEAGEPISYATLSFNQARYGTLSDANGYFRIPLPPGDYSLKITHLGYTPLETRISLTADKTLRFVLSDEELSLDEVVIVPGGEDPAYPIMREAIRRKDENKLVSDQLAYDAYTKTVFKLADSFSFEELVKSMPGATGTDTIEVPDDPLFKTNIIYLSENSSRVWKAEPDKIKEQIIRTHVSGSQAGSSIFGDFFNQFSPYENLLFKGEMAERGIISPLSDQAMLFYRFKLIGVSKVAGLSVYKIEVTPKRIHDAAFQGIIQIADSSYAVQSLDLYVTKEQSVQLVDSLRMTQEYFLENGKWAPLSTRMHLAISMKILVFTLPLNGTFTSVLSNYDLHPDIDDKFFSQEVIAIVDTAINTDSMWWETNRPIPLLDREALDFRLKDSLERVQNSPQYLDSLTKSQGFPGFNSLLTGYTWQNYRTGAKWKWRGIWSSGYNAIEGWYAESGASYFHPIGKKMSWELGSDIRYAFSPNRFHAIGFANMERKGFRPWSASIKGGDYVAEFSNIPQISPFANTFASLWYHRSHIRMYRRQFGSVEGEWELLPGLSVLAKGLVEQRSSLENTDEYSIRFKDRTYEDNFSIPTHTAYVASASVVYRPFQPYIKVPEGKILMSSKWPEFQADIWHGIGVQATSPSFTKLALTIRDDVSLGLLGTLSYRATAGRFLQNQLTYLPDAFHFHGGETFFRMGEGFDQFFLMPYYSYSDTRPFVELHAENAFGIFVTGKIPLLRKLKISEYLGGHALMMEGRAPYAEVNYGLEFRILKAFKLRLDVNVFLTGEDRWLPYGFTYRPESLLQLGLQ
ncbi:MAG: DUF5686 and carboxypeptidase regulatory-like domain-containing protein [Bacteroidia bacterium]|nr:DUF5686 and carboxypeptidase regulatory-like domain-containing protein [Bacteroidia bacterium]